MNYTFGKIGLGLAGAVAAVGLMTAGVRVANAQITLAPPLGIGAGGNPVVTPDSKNPGEWTWSYVMQIGNGSVLEAPTTSGGITTYNTYFVLTDFAGYDATAQSSLLTLGANPGTGLTPAGSSWTITTPATISVPGITVADSPYVNDLVVEYTGTTQSNATTGNISLGTFQFDSMYGPGNANISGYEQSLVGETTLTGGVVLQGNYQANVAIPAAPLPAAFWPGLMTLGGMAVVGGLRLRRRAV